MVSLVGRFDYVLFSCFLPEQHAPDSKAVTEPVSRFSDTALRKSWPL